MVFFDMSPKSPDSWPETWKSPDWFRTITVMAPDVSTWGKTANPIGRPRTISPTASGHGILRYLFLHKVCVWRNDERSNRWRRATKCQQGASKSTVALVAPIGTLKLISNLPKMLADYFNHPQCLEQNCQTLRLCFNDDLIGAPYLGKTLSLPTFTSTLRLGYPKLTSAPRLLRGPICHLCGG